MQPLPDPLEPFRAEAEGALRAGLATLGAGEVEPRLVRAPEGKGDFAFACHPLAAKLRKAPPALAQELAAALPRSDLVAPRVEGPYVNFTMADARLATEVLRSVLARGEQYGSLPSTGQRVIVEHTSANPTGPFHVGRARNPIIGDSLARVLRAAGHEVATEYYVNDMGKQVVTLTWGARNLGPQQVQAPARPDKPDHVLVSRYQKASELLERDPNVGKEIGELLQRYEGGDRQVAQAVRETVEYMLRGLQQSLDRMRVRVDRFSWESRYVYSGDVDKVMQRLKQSPRIREEQGAFYLDLEGLGVAGKSQKFFLTRSDGTTLYPVRDVAYHLDKFGRSDRAIDVLGEDHKLEAKQLTIALQELGEARTPEVVFYAFVKLPEGRMSTRKGTVVYIDDLLDEAEERALAEVQKRRPELDEERKRAIARLVGMGAVRFNIAAVQAEKGITFQWEEALDFEGSSAPFVQYSHARAASILRKAAEEGHVGGEADTAAKLTDPNELALLRVLGRLPSLVKQCAAESKVHPVAGYAVELANAFNQFYRDSPVLLAEPEVRAARLALVVGAKHGLRNSLDLLGVEAPEGM
ncbi:MAG TPA: arginine--tRNA ligase [Candidatus Thermoplasmatota archaeon]|nr:arginine--tRNA ligase [Candidatus Thermoplasmatota archaeon]